MAQSFWGKSPFLRIPPIIRLTTSCKEKKRAPPKEHAHRHKTNVQDHAGKAAAEFVGEAGVGVEDIFATNVKKCFPKTRMIKLGAVNSLGRV